MRKLIKIFILIGFVVQSLSVAAAASPSSRARFTFEYDRLNEATVAYDSSDKSSVGYDVGSVLTTGEKEDRMTGGHVSFVQFAKFLAAETGVNLTAAELEQLYPRITPRRGLAEEVWERSKAPNGKVYDPSGVEIKPGDYWELGHKPGHQIPDARLRAAEEGWDRPTWRKYQNDPDIYRPELRRTNRSHVHESDW